MSKLTEQRKEQMREYARVNRQRQYEYQKEYLKERRGIDEVYDMNIRIRSLFHVSRRNGGYSSKSKLNNILGCSYKDFIQHIENTWEEWMNWNNYGRGIGTWQIDHIIPTSDASTKDELKTLHHFTNTRAIATEDNISRNFN